MYKFSERDESGRGVVVFSVLGCYGWLLAAAKNDYYNDNYISVHTNGR